MEDEENDKNQCNNFNDMLSNEYKSDLNKKYIVRKIIEPRLRECKSAVKRATTTKVRSNQVQHKYEHIQNYKETNQGIITQTLKEH